MTEATNKILNFDRQPYGVYEEFTGQRFEVKLSVDVETAALSNFKPADTFTATTSEGIKIKLENVRFTEKRNHVTTVSGTYQTGPDCFTPLPQYVVE